MLLRRARRLKGRSARRAGAEPGFPARTASVLPTASPRRRPKDARVSVARSRGCRPGGAESVKTQRRGLNSTERCASSPQARGRRLLTGTRDRTGSRSPRDPVSTESRAGGQGHAGPLLPGRTPEPQAALGVTGASDRPPAPARPPRPDPREKRPPCWWPGQHRVGLGAPRTPFPGTERSPPWGCPSVPPAAALPASAGPLLNSQPATPLLQRRPLTRRFSGSGSLPQVSDTSCAKGLVSIPVCPPPPPLLELTPAYCTPTPRRPREASNARRKTA